MKKKGFTLVELLVVIAIIAMLLAILMPALGKVRQLAYRLMCGTNLKGLGTAMMVYSNDYDESYPRSGGKGGASLKWSNTVAGGSWAWNVNEATTKIDWSATTDASVTSTWFLLIKYADVSAAQFVCQASNQKKFEFNATTAGNSISDITGLWDFGLYTSGSTTDRPALYVSYCMQNPFFSYSASVSGSAGKPLAADRNPWIEDDGDFITAVGTVAAAPQLLTGASTTTESVWDKSSADNRKGASSQAHQAEGQNVLFNDGHVSFEKTVVCGLETDNIYTTWGVATLPTSKPTDTMQIGAKPTKRDITLTTTTDNVNLSRGESDSYLTL